jgi:hypothetical protein
LKYIKTYHKLLEFYSNNITTNSLDKPIHSTIQGIENFWKWFGDSKIVDKNGKPLIVYHGSENIDSIEIFKSSKGHPYNFFSEDEYEAERYTNQNKNNIKSFYLKALKIYNTNNLNSKELKDLDILLNNKIIIDTFIESIKNIGIKTWKEYMIEIYDDDYGNLFDAMKKVLIDGGDNWWLLETEPFQKYIIDNGYDSFTTNEGDGHYFFNIAVYSPYQIKSATDNNGNFDINNPNVNL